MTAARFHAPAEHGAVLIDPPPHDWPRLVEENARLLRLAVLSCCGLSLQEWRAITAALVKELASRQLQRWGLTAPLNGAGWLVTGHQPELFHPGVWAKHFAVAEAAKCSSLIPLNLIADHDQPKHLAVRAPVHTPNGLSALWIPFCEASPVLPWEEYLLSSHDDNSLVLGVVSQPASESNLRPANCLCSRATFFSLAERVFGVAQDLLPEMILPRFWSHLENLAERLDGTCALAELLAGARRSWEEHWGYGNGEVRVSALCGGEAFLAFVAQILGDLPAFAATHNAELSAFRRDQGIRSRTHPVPPLLQEEDWYEAPFWVWRAGQPRQRLWAQPQREIWRLRSGEGGAVVAVRSVRGRDDLIELGQQLAETGWKIRPRALTLTMFVRLFLAEMFVHGIGGGVYDRFTDRLIWRYWRLVPPRYSVVTATLRLPLPEPAPPPLPREVLLTRLRDCRFNPDRVLPRESLVSPEVRQLVERKRALLRHWPEASLHQRRMLHRELCELRQALQPLARPVEAELRAALEKLTLRQQQLALARDREWAFVLHAERALSQLVERIHQEFTRGRRC